jgi:CSLREA domain-containing protein
MTEMNSKVKGLSRKLRVSIWFSRIPMSVQLAAVIILALAGPRPGNAANIIVNSTAEGPGGANNCTLAEAIAAANSDARVDRCTAGSGADTITLPANTYLLTRVNNNTRGPNGLPSIRSNITINGAGATTTIIARLSNAPEFRIFHVTSRGALTLNGLTITGGSLPLLGALSQIFSWGDLWYGLSR